jgi:hypothetical protein
MNRRDLNQEQLRALEAIIDDMQCRLRLILARMDQRHFRQNDKLRQLVQRSCDNMQELRMYALYRSHEIDLRSPTRGNAYRQASNQMGSSSNSATERPDSISE